MGASAGLTALKGGAALGKVGKLGVESIGGASVFGGGAALNESIRTLGTDKPFEVKQVAVEGLIGATLPYAREGIKFIAKPFRKAVVKNMQKTGSTAIASSEELFEKAQKSGISIEKLSDGSKSEAKKFTQLLNKEAKAPAMESREAMVKNIQRSKERRTLPSRIKEIPQGEAAISSEKVSRALPEFAESPKAGWNRLKRTSQELSKSDYDLYLKTKPETPIVSRRREQFKLEKEANKKEISRLNAQRKNLVESSARKENQVAIDRALKNEYGIEFKTKYGHEPTLSSIMDKVNKAEENLVKDIINPTISSTKSLSKFNKTSNTFVKRAESEMVYGKNAKELPDKFVNDYMIETNERYLKMYERVKKEKAKELLNPDSFLSKSGKGSELIDQLNSKITSSKNRIQVQTRKRKSLEAIKGPTGVTYRKWIDHIKGEQKLFNKDMLSISNEITKYGKKITPTALKKIDKTAAYKKGKGKYESVETKAVEKPASKVEVKKAFESGESAINESKEKFVEKASSLGITEKESERQFSFLKRLGKYMTSGEFETGRKNRVKIINDFLKTPMNQIVTGMALGSISNLYEKATGKKMPVGLRGAVYGYVGLSGKMGGRKPWLTAAASLTDWGENTIKVKNARGNYRAARTSADRRRLVKKYKKEGFSAKELKEVRS